MFSLKKTFRTLIFGTSKFWVACWNLKHSRLSGTPFVYNTMAHNIQPALTQIGHFRKGSASKQQADAFVRKKLDIHVEFTKYAVYKWRSGKCKNLTNTVNFWVTFDHAFHLRMVSWERKPIKCLHHQLFDSVRKQYIIWEIQLYTDYSTKDMLIISFDTTQMTL